MVNNITQTKWFPQQMFTPKSKSIEITNCNSIKENQYKVHHVNFICFLIVSHRFIAHIIY